MPVVRPARGRPRPSLRAQARPAVARRRPRRGRRSVTTWICAAGLSDQFRPSYTAVAAAAKKAEAITARLVTAVVKPLVSEAERPTLAIDETPTRRWGPHVQGGGTDHNPAPGPVGAPYVCGHVFVVLALLAIHPAWGVVALPLLARMYDRKGELPRIDAKHRPVFRTELELAVELLRWARAWPRPLGKPIWVVADGAYAKRDFLKPAVSLRMTVVSRLRCDAALWSLPPVIPPDQKGPGRPGIYATERISLAKRAGQRQGSTTEVFTLYGERLTKRYKTFLATWKPAGGVIRVVLVDGLAGLLLHGPGGIGRGRPYGRSRSVQPGHRLPELPPKRRGVVSPSYRVRSRSRRY